MRFFVFLIALPLCCYGTGAAADSQPPDVILTIAAFNDDCVPDTLIATWQADSGGTASHFYYEPAYIRWGVFDAELSPACDADTLSPIPPERKVSETVFAWPSWDLRRVFVSPGHRNPHEDTLTDLVFYHSGRDTTVTPSLDLAGAAAVFGSRGLDTLPLLDLPAVLEATTGSVQTTPFVAKRLFLEVDLTEPDERDQSGVESYVLEPLSTGVPGALSAPPTSTPAAAANIKVWPNPSGTITHVEAEGLAPGVYEVALYDLHGRRHRRATVRVGAVEHSLYRSIGTGDLPTGLYLVQIFLNHAPVASWPVVIIN